MVMEMFSQPIDMVAAPDVAPIPVGDGWEWAVGEVFGRRKHAGRTREVERFGAKMLRVDNPIKGDTANGWETVFYGGLSASWWGSLEWGYVQWARTHLPRGESTAPA